MMKHLMILVLLGTHIQCFSQDDSDVILDPSLNEAALFESDMYEYYVANKINLSQSTYNDIALLPGISVITAKRIKRMLLDSTLSLQNIIQDTALHLSIYQQQVLQYCTYIGESLSHIDSSYLQLHGKQRIRYLQKSGASKGQINSNFTGSAHELYSRTQMTTGDIQSGFTFCKDSDEPYIFSFLSYYASYTKDSFTVLLGDYIPHISMGSLLSSGLRFSGGLYPISSLNSWKTSIKPWTSSMEHIYFRGISVEHVKTVNHLTVHSALFYSNRNRSANLDLNGAITGFPINGLYRTSTEQHAINNAKETKYGAFSEISDSLYKVTLALLMCNYDKPIHSNSEASFQQAHNITMSIAGKYSINNIHLQSEFLLDKNFAYGFQSAFVFNKDIYNIGIGISNWPIDVLSPFGQTIGRFIKPTNQSSIYAALEYKASHHLYFSGYALFYSSKQPRFGDDFPKTGMITSIQCKVHTSLKTYYLLQFSDEISSETELLIPQHRIYSSMQTKRFQAGCSSSHSTINIQYKVAYTSKKYKESGRSEYGLAGSLLLSGTLPYIENLQIQIKQTVFSVSDYIASIWFPESGLPGQIFFNPLYGKGVQTIISAKYSIHNRVSISTNISGIYKPLQKELGSGLDAIAGSSRYSYGIQADIQF